MGGIRHESCGHRAFDVLELVVHRLVADRDLVFELARGSMHRGLLAEDDAGPQSDERREQQFIGVGPLSRACEQLSEVLGSEDAFEDQPGHDGDGRFLEEGFKELVEQQGGVLSLNPSGEVCERIVYVYGG